MVSSGKDNFQNSVQRVEEREKQSPSLRGDRDRHGETSSKKTYQDAVAGGFYQRDSGGLYGKHDNVRRYWEDQITRYALHEFVGPLVARKRQQLSRVRVLDLGAGSGEGYEVISSLKKRGGTLASREVDLLPVELIGFYKGVDVSPAMVEQGAGTYQSFPKVAFEVADLSKGLGAIKEDAPYDIYFSSYGSLSHLNDNELEHLIEDIYDHCEEKCVFVMDLLGRFSFEWQQYWDYTSSDGNNMREYTMSYLYPGGGRDQVDVESFPMRYWGGKEVDEFISRIIERKGGDIGRKLLWDRSVFVGRHMETATFNPLVQPIRSAVNSLHEFNVRTDLEALIFDYTPHQNFEELNEFFSSFQVAWDAVVYAAIEALYHWKDPHWLTRPPPEAYPEVVQEAISTIRNVVRHVQWFRMGDPRANVVEPQLGYTLRNLEMDFQRGVGAGHGLVAIYEWSKNKDSS